MALPRTILDIALLQRGPQALPASQAVMITALLVYVLAGIAGQRQVTPGQPALPPVLFDVSLSVALITGALWVRGRLERFPQTITALAGTGTVLTLCGLPVILMLQSDPDAGGIAAAASLLWIGLICWSLVVTAHILRHALSIPLTGAMLVAFCFLTASVFAYGAIFGGAA